MHTNAINISILNFIKPIYLQFLLVNLNTDENWYQFDNGKTIGTKGSEGGIIVEDLEHRSGARTTIEKDCDIAPFAITVGVYGLLFHTIFCGTIDEAKTKTNILKRKVESLLVLLETPENERDISWHDGFNEIMEKITAVN